MCHVVHALQTHSMQACCVVPQAFLCNNVLCKDVAGVVPPAPLAVLLEALLAVAVVDFPLFTVAEHVVCCGHGMACNGGVHTINAYRG